MRRNSQPHIIHMLITPKVSRISGPSHVEFENVGGGPPPPSLSLGRPLIGVGGFAMPQGHAQGDRLGAMVRSARRRRARAS
jgi:hypothetical protein